MASSENPSITFKSVNRRKNFRQRRKVETEEEESEENKDGEEFNVEKMNETREIQKLRQRNNGVSHVTLASGKKLSKVEEMVAVNEDPFKLKTGGLLTLNKAKAARKAENPELNSESAETDTGGIGDGMVGTQFSKETRIRDEDEEMRKFIEAEMEKRQGKEATRVQEALKYFSPEDRALMSLPDHLRKSTFKKNEEMLSSQMLSGIPEVDLGIEEKIRNIEATENAKKKMAEADKNRKKAPEFVPTNLAVNFKQPSRFKLDADDDEEPSAKISKVASQDTVITQRTVVVGEVPEERVIKVDEGDTSFKIKPDQASDDLHVNKFKQHFQRK